MLPRAGLLAAFSAALAFVACDPGGSGTQSNAQDVEEVDEDCRVCLVDLAECASTAKTEEQFVECRDLFATCQSDADLGADECGSPSARLACGLCQDRLASCDGEVCDAEFGTCRSLLIRGAASASCEPRQEEAPQATCDDCLRELAACASSDEASVCQNGFAQCRDVSGLGDSCGNPTDAQACELCDAQADTCAAQADEGTCVAARDACIGQLASSPDACPDVGTGAGGGAGEGGGTGEGGGGEGGSSGTGEGGGDTTTTGGGSCTFDGCGAGDAPTAECNACTAEVCAADAYCCEGYWDETCVGLAEASDSCGCAGDTCAHDVCATGVALESTCNDCATQVCAQDEFCCTVEWDTTCTELAASTCGCSI